MTALPDDDALLALLASARHKKERDPVGDFLAAWAVLFAVLLGGLGVEIMLGVVTLPK